MSKYPTYKELYKENKELRKLVEELECEIEELEGLKYKMDKIYQEASYQYDNYYGNISEFSTIARMSRR